MEPVKVIKAEDLTDEELFAIMSAEIPSEYGHLDDELIGD